MIKCSYFSGTYRKTLSVVGDASAVKELVAAVEIEEPGHLRNWPSRPAVFPILITYNKHNPKLDCHDYIYPKIH